MKVRWIFLCAFLSLAADLKAGVLARFRMNNLGTIDVELFDQDKPVTVSNFVAYVKSGQWHDGIVHRWAKDFVIQGGSYKLPHADTGFTPLSVNAAAVTHFPAIPFEAGVGRKFSNIYGTIAMARVGTDTNSATTDWFFNLGSNVSLDTQDGGYTVFGHTLRGTNVLDSFKSGTTSPNLYIANFGSAAPTCPVWSTDGQNGYWINVDVTLLTAQIAKVTGGNQISWNSVEGKQNIVEYATTNPPVWQQAVAVAGTGAQMSITNDPGSDPFRVYRVRIDYTN